MTSEILAWVGFGCVAYGAGLLHPAAGFIAAGVMLLAVGIGGGVADARKQKEKR